MNNVIIIGSGPAGLTAAIYLARADLKPIVFAGIQYGGQLMGTTEVENYPGFEEGVIGPDLIQKMIKQAEKFGAKIIYENVNEVEFPNAPPFKIKTEKETYEAKAVIVATGAYPRKLDLKSESKLWGRGISSCATCDGAFFKEKVVAVLGGGDSAMEESNFLTRFATKVYLIHRRDSFRASKIMVDKVLKNAKIEILYNTEITDILGDQKVQGLKIINKKTQTEKTLELDGLFLAIGYIPATKIFEGQLEMDKMGYIVQKDHTETNIKGIFVAGDVEDFRYRQAVTAAGDGCKAALDAEKYLEEHLV